jgi:hypothetical protein
MQFERNLKTSFCAHDCPSARTTEDLYPLIPPPPYTKTLHKLIFQSTRQVKNKCASRNDAVIQMIIYRQTLPNRRPTSHVTKITYWWGTLWGSWLRNCATSRKVAGSIPDGVIGTFHWHNPSGSTMALGSTQPLTEMSTRNIPWG